MNGGPSQMDLFDPKPMLDKHHGQDHFEKIAGEVENPQAAGALMRSPFKFARHGASGMWVSEAMPHLATQVDNISLIRSMFTHQPDARTGVVQDSFRQRVPRTSVAVGLGVLRTGQRESEFAGLCGVRRSARSAGQRNRQLAGGISAGSASGNALPARYRLAGVEPETRLPAA